MPSFLHSGNYSFFLNDTYSPVVDLQSKLAYMWDAEYSSTITRDGGGLVSEWRDLVDGTPMVQATGASQPVYSATSFGGGAGVTFDGVDDQLTYTMPGVHRFPLNAEPFECWVLVSNATSSADTAVKYFFGYGGNAYRHLGRFGASVNDTRTRSHITTGAGAVNLGTLRDLGLNTRFFFRVSNDGAATVIQNNNSEYETDVASAAMVPNTNAGRARIGASAATTAASFLNGTVACVCLFNKLLTVDETDALAGYMHQRRRLG